MFYLLNSTYRHLPVFVKANMVLTPYNIIEKAIYNFLSRFINTNTPFSIFTYIRPIIPVIIHIMGY